MPSDMPSKKQRLDVCLVERGLVESRTRAQALVMAGLVYRNTDRLDKASIMVGPEDNLMVKGKEHPWVSRGGLKLAHGLKAFALDCRDCVCIDVGCSTGGFTDVLLNNGARRVYAVDVGHGQLDWKIRNDERVVVLERTNARHLISEHIPEAVSVIVCDASFIGLKTVLPPALALASHGAIMVALIKPQFEVGRAQVGKGGVVRDAALHDAVCLDIQAWLSEEMGWTVLGIETSPITGPGGNKEFLIAAQRENGD